jgi:hypothetical protein
LSRQNISCKRSVGGALFLVASLLLMLGSAAPAVADSFTQYTYTGKVFTTQFENSCPPICKITGSFIVASPLAANLNNATITPLSYSFTDGVTILTQANSQIENFDFFSTNGVGAIKQWDIFLCAPGCIDFTQLIATTTEGSFIDLTANFVTGAESDSEKKGKWTAQSVNVPEPAVLVLLLVGLLFVAGMKRKQMVLLAA